MFHVAEAGQSKQARHIYGGWVSAIVYDASVNRFRRVGVERFAIFEKPVPMLLLGYTALHNDSGRQHFPQLAQLVFGCFVQIGVDATNPMKVLNFALAGELVDCNVDRTSFKVDLIEPWKELCDLFAGPCREPKVQRIRLRLFLLVRLGLDVEPSLRRLVEQV